MDEYERLVVLLEARINQFEKAMKQAEARGSTTYQKMQDGAFKATNAMEKRMADTAKAMGRSLESIWGNGSQWKNRAEQYADFRAFTQSAEAVDRLRSSLDPVYAASKRYEGAVRDLDDALARNVITEQQHAAMVEQVGRAYLTTDAAAGNHAGSLGRLGSMSNATRQNIQNLGFQVQDVAVQMASGTDASRALAQQLPQMLGGFGLVGVAVGTLAAVGLPLLGAAFGSTEGAARSFDDAMGDVQNSVRALNDQAALHTAEGLVALKEKYGELNAELMLFIERQRQADIVQAIGRTAEAMRELQAEVESGWFTTATDDIRILFETTNDGARMLMQTMEDAAGARTFESQLASVTALRVRIEELTGGIEGMTAKQFTFYQKVLSSEDALRQLAEAVPKADWLSGMIGQAQTLATTLWDAVAAKLEVAREGAFDAAGNRIPEGVSPGRRPPTRPSGFAGEHWGAPPDRKGRGGGGGAKEKSRLETLMADLQTEREVVAAWYEESLATIQTATDAQLTAIGGRHEAIERLEAEHYERLRGIRDGSNSGALANAEQFFGQMAAATAAGGDRMLRITRVFSAAQALINSYVAYTEVLKDPTLPWWARIPKAAAVLASGMQMVSAIKGGGGSGGGGSGGGASAGSKAQAPAAAEPEKGPLQVTVKGLDPNALFTGQMVMDIYDALLKEAGNRGIRPVWQ